MAKSFMKNLYGRLRHASALRSANNAAVYIIVGVGVPLPHDMLYGSACRGFIRYSFPYLSAMNR